MVFTLRMGVSPFQINIEPQEVARLKRKLEDTRLPKDPIVPDAAGDYGRPPSNRRLLH